MLLSLSGCSFLSPVEIEPPKKYLLNEIPTNLPVEKTHAGTLLIQPPDTRPIYNTTKMAYTTRAHQIEFYNYNEWSETPSQMLQTLLVSTLQQTHAFNAVVTLPNIGHQDYVLATQIQEFVLDLTECPAVFRITVRAQLSQGSPLQVIAQEDFTAEEPIPEVTPYCAVIAANDAMAEVLEQLADFVIDHRQLKAASAAEYHPYKQSDAASPR
jgi:cholesterol transport system auxiliary component